MPNAESHAPEKNRRYLGAESADALVRWLNSAEDADGRSRIIAIMNAFIEAAPLSIKTASFFPKKNETKRDVKTTERLSLKKVQRRLDTLLSHYVMVPQISMATNWDGIRESLYTVGWRSISHSGVRARAEIGALLDLLELIKSGLVAKIAPCQFDGCHKVYFLKFSHQRFCSLKCRVAASRDSDEARTKRAAYARKLYHIHKTKNVK